MEGIDESYPASLPASEVARYIASKEAAAYRTIIHPDELIITADTVVIVGDDILGKPEDEADAVRMLREISGRTHHVTTGVCLLTAQQERCFDVTTEVTFKVLSDEEISYYVAKYKPFDKAGAYGIQEWILCSVSIRNCRNYVLRCGHRWWHTDRGGNGRYRLLERRRGLD